MYNLINVVLPSGNRAIYDVQPQHMPLDSIPESYQWPSMYGVQKFVRIGGDWYRTGQLTEKITDPTVLAAIGDVWAI